MKRRPVTNAQFILDYTLDEQAIGINWIDGKPIYRRIVILTTVGNNKSEAPFSDLGIIDTLISMNATLKTTDGDFISDAKIAVGDVGKKMDPTKIEVMHQGFTSESGVVFLRYTKNNG